MTLLFFSTNAARRALVRAVWAETSPESLYLAVDDLADAALHGQSGRFEVLLVDGDDEERAAILLRFMRRHNRVGRVIVHGGSGEHSDWTRLKERLSTISLPTKDSG